MRRAMRVVNSLENARVALTEGFTELCSPPFAACHAGVNYYSALLATLKHEFPRVDIAFTLCCGDDSAIAHDALRLGFAHVLCDCEPRVFEQLAQIAASQGATLARRSNALDATQHTAKPMTN